MESQKYIELFSKERIESYRSIEEHDKNLKFIGEITEILGTIEIVFRNKIDKKMTLETGNNWISNMRNNFISKLTNIVCKNKPIEKRILNQIDKVCRDGNIELLHSQLISKLNFGFWVEMVFYMIDYKNFDCNGILDSKKIDVTNYSIKNKKINDEKLKIKLVFKLIQKIRNRAFHWENLLKINKKVCHSKTKEISNIYVTIHGINCQIMPTKIKVFLNNILFSIDESLIDKSPCSIGGD